LIMKVFKKLTKGEFKKDLAKAVAFFRKTSYRSPDKVMVNELFLPRITTPSGEVIDLNELYADCQVITTHVGRMPYIPYIALKGQGSGEPELYVHFPDIGNNIELVVDPDQSYRLFLVHSGKMKMTERGLVH